MKPRLNPPRKTHPLLAWGAVALAVQFAAPAFAAKDVVIAVQSNFTTTDPYDANDTLSQAVAKSFYQGLFGFDKDMKLVNVLAESYQAAKDGLSYTIKLRKGVKFHSGEELTADDVFEYCGAQLAPFKVPRYVEFRDELPHTPTFKIQKEPLVQEGDRSGWVDRLAGGRAGA